MYLDYIVRAVEDRVVDTNRRSGTRMRERTRHWSGNIRFPSHERRHPSWTALTRPRIITPPKDDPAARPEA